MTLAEKLMLANGIPTGTALDLLNGISPEQSAGYSNRLDEIGEGLRTEQGAYTDKYYQMNKRQGYAKGTASVKRKTDSVPAMLTPREAILNRNAAELLGRDTIKRLNDHGNMLSRRGVDLASLPSDPTPGPSTENMLGYQYGTSMVQGDDRADLLRDADSTFYGGGQAPAPTPTPTPARRYQYGTSSVDDTINTKPVKKRTGVGLTADSLSQGLSLGGAATQFGSPSPTVAGSVFSRVRTGASQNTATQPQPMSNPMVRPMTHTEMMADIASRNKAAVAPLPQPLGMGQSQPNQPTLTGYHWYAGTGGVSGGNNAFAKYQWSDNNVTRGPAGSQFDMPKLGLPMSQQPSIGQGPAPYTISPENITSYTQAGGQGGWDVSIPGQPVFRGQNLPFTPDAQGVPRQWGSVPAGGDPSVGALQGSTRSTNQAGLPVINTPSGGQIIGSLPKPDKDQGYGSAYGY